MSDGRLPHESEHLRVLIANELVERVAVVTEVVQGLGHDVVARVIDVENVGAVTRAERPDVALVGLGENTAHALEMIEKIVHEAACPVIALLDTKDSSFVNEAAKRGVFAYVTDRDPERLQGALDIVLRRFAEYHSLEGAFGRRAMIERAKGILMAVHAVDEKEAFELLRGHSQRNGRKLVDVADAVVESHRLLSVKTPELPNHSA
jgi:AmiR/NasT family two-component response regulator